MPIRVPDVTGLRTDDAAKRLRGEGLVTGTLRLALSNEHEAGIVTGQTPRAGAAAQRGTEVALVVSSGKITPLA